LAKEDLRALNASLEARVEERTEALQSSIRFLETFAYSVAHDFRAPLRAMDGYSALLLDQHRARQTDEGRDYLNRIRDSSVRLGKLIDDLLKLAQVTKQNIATEDVDLSTLAMQTLTTRLDSELHRAVEVVISPGMCLNGDPVLIDALVKELIDNALQFTAPRENARIEVGQMPGASGDTFYVKDNGIGFDMAFASKLFVPFARLHGGEISPGTGIGLAIAKSIVDRHGGRIWAQASVGQGATFLFTLTHY
jgi:signal transduction histidine kinase